MLPLVITSFALAFAMAPDSLQRLGAGNPAVTWFAVLGGLAMLTLGLWAMFDRLLRRHQLVLGAKALEVKTGFNRCQVAYADLRLDDARVVDLGERTEFKPMLKLNGTGLPGFGSGWYLLRDRSRAFVAITGGPRVLWIPTRGKHALLLQPRQPQALLDALRALARGDGRGG
ncbi:MAG: hypothetical protein M3485_05345 [Pseudomonadota bacterium]|nr:hypothetical protein [Pseudomonadota bacterium]